MKGAGVVQRRRVQLLQRADHAAAIDRLVEGIVADHEPPQPAVGRGQYPLAQLFLNDRTLGLEGRLVDHRPRHPLGMGPQDGLQILGRHRLVIVGEILAGRGVARAADVLDDGRDLAVGQVDGLAAEDVFEQVGEAAAALRIVLAADVVPQGHRHRAGRRVGHGIDVQPVGQFAVAIDQRRHRDRGDGGRGELGLGQGRGGQRQDGQGDPQQGGAGQAETGHRRRLRNNGSQTLAAPLPGDSYDAVMSVRPRRYALSRTRMAPPAPAWTSNRPVARIRSDSLA